MLLHFGKCKCIHIGHGNMDEEYKMGDAVQGRTTQEKEEQCRLDTRNYSFSQRVINELNKLPNDCVYASSVNMFKNIIDIYLIRVGYT